MLAALCLTVPASLRAQNTEPHFVQRLTWVGDRYATRYEVVIEKEENGEYKKVLQEFTTASFIEVSLPHGKYRFQVIPYDFFNNPVPETEWMDFEILLFVAQDQPDNTVPDPEPETVIENKNQFYIYLGLTWIPTVPIYGEYEFLDKNLSPYVAGLRLAIFPAKQKSLKFGMEGSSLWRFSPDNQPVQSLTLGLNVVMRFSDGLAALNSKIGGGVSLRSGISPVSANDLYGAHANLGVSFLVPFSEHLHLETGMEYVQFFSNSGILRPSLALGYRF
jgi:hypothetical protein